MKRRRAVARATGAAVTRAGIMPKPKASAANKKARLRPVRNAAVAVGLVPCVVVVRKADLPGHAVGNVVRAVAALALRGHAVACNSKAGRKAGLRGHAADNAVRVDAALARRGRAVACNPRAVRRVDLLGLVADNVVRVDAALVRHGHVVACSPRAGRMVVRPACVDRAVVRDALNLDAAIVAVVRRPPVVLEDGDRNPKLAATAVAATTIVARRAVPHLKVSAVDHLGCVAATMIVADRVDLPGCATATTMIAGLMDVAVRTWTAIVATVPRASPPSSVEMVRIANTAGMVAENAASVAVRIAMAIVTAAAVDADVNWQDQQSDDPKISTKARFVMNRALCFVRLKIESGLRIDLAGGLDRDAFEAAGLGVGITGGKGFRLGSVGDVYDDETAGGRLAIVGQCGAGEGDFLDIGIEVFEVGRAVFLADGESVFRVDAVEGE